MTGSDKQEKRKKLFKDFEITEYDIDLILKRELDEKKIEVQSKKAKRDLESLNKIGLKEEENPIVKQTSKPNQIFSNNFARTESDISKLKYSNIIKLIKLEEKHLKFLLEKQILKKRELFDKKNKIKNEEFSFNKEEIKIENFRKQHQKLKDKIFLLEVYSNKSKQDKFENNNPFKELNKDFDSPLTNNKIKLERQDKFEKIVEPSILFNKALIENNFEYKNENNKIEIEKPKEFLEEKNIQEIPKQKPNTNREKITLKEIDSQNKNSELKGSKIEIPKNVHTKPKHSFKKILNIVIVSFIVIVGFLVAYILNIENSYDSSDLSSTFTDTAESINSIEDVYDTENINSQIEEIKEDEVYFNISADTEQSIDNFNDTFSNVDETNSDSEIKEENEINTFIIEEDSVDSEDVLTISKTTTIKSRLARNSHRIKVDKPIGFYFVLGSFSTMKNALNYKSQFSSNKLIIINSNGIKVCASAEGTDEELMSRLHEIHEIGFANAWLLFNEGI